MKVDLTAARGELARLKSLSPATAAALIDEVERLRPLESETTHAQELRAELGAQRQLVERGMAGQPIQIDGAWWTLARQAP